MHKCSSTLCGVPHLPLPTMWAFSRGMQVMRLIITKPSMGRDVAAALGVTTRRDGYLEGAHDLVTWCIGHVVELDEPEAYDPTWKQWRLADLPLFPATFTYHPCAKTLDQFTILKHLLQRADVTTIVNAADAGVRAS